jgi:hypothetical protein
VNTYNDFQNSASSEKVTLAIVDGSKRLIAFSLHSGSVYKLLSFDVSVITSIEVSGVALTEVASLALVATGTYYNDRENATLYLWLTGSINPNAAFVVLTSKYFFSNRPTTLPWDLDAGFDVYFEPMIKSTSAFGVELDIVNEATSAIEGQGSITFFNDSNFWPANYDKIFFENQTCSIYSWNSNLEATEAKLLFKGFVESKSYSSNEITLSLKDLLYQIRSSIGLSNIQDLGLRNDPALNTAKQRLVYGKVQGHRPVNLDKLINTSYPITGTISVFFNETSVVGTSTRFKDELSTNDKLIIAGVQYTIASISGDTTAELTRPYAAVTIGNVAVEVVPATNKNYINREWLLAGHALSQPTPTIQHGSTTSRLVLSTTQDLYDGDDIYIGEIGSGELVRINQIINGTIATLAQSTATIYPADTPIHRPCVQNVRMNDLELVYLEDYMVDPNAGRLTLTESAEENRAQLLESTEGITVTSGNDYFTGSGTNFTNYIKPGYKVRPQSTDIFYKVLAVTDTRIDLTENYTGPSFTTATALPEKTSISGLANYRERYLFRAVQGTDLQAKYFKIWDSAGSVAIWFDVGNIGTPMPVHGCDRAIEITTVDSGDSKYTILSKIAQKLNLDNEFTCDIVGADTMTIENKTMGVRPAAQTSDTNFSMLSRTGSEQRVICVADVADSLDGKYFILYDGSGSVAFWIDTDNSGTLEPNHGASRSVEITTIVTDDTAATVMTKVKAFVEADAAFTTSSYGSTGFIATCTMIGPSLGTLPAGFELTVSQSGKSAWDLNGKFFVLPHHYAGTDRTAGFWFDIDNNGTSAPSTGATANTEISTVNSDFTEQEIFEAISNVIEAHANFTSEYSENSILVTDAANEDVTTVLNAGTSGLTIVQSQAGVTSNPLTGKLLQYKSFVFGDSDVLSCDVTGKTVDGLSTGRMLKTAPEIVRDLLVDAGLQASINEVNFAAARNYFSEELAFCVPKTFSDKASKLTYRDVINSVNNSVFGMLLQNNNFELEYASLRPRVSASMPYYNESDIIHYKTDSTNKNMIKQAVVEYGFKEYDYSTKSSIISSVNKSSDIAEFILGTTKVKTYDSLCVNEADAQRLANRWAFLLEYSSNSITFNTKLVASQLQINDVIQVSHRKMYDRLGGVGSVKILIVERIAKKGDGVEITAIDLSNAFNRVAKISNTTTTYGNSNDETKLQSGFYTDENGLIDNDENSFYTNLIW